MVAASSVSFGIGSISESFAAELSTRSAEQFSSRSIGGDSALANPAVQAPRPPSQPRRAPGRQSVRFEREAQAFVQRIYQDRKSHLKIPQPPPGSADGGRRSVTPSRASTFRGSSMTGSGQDLLEAAMAAGLLTPQGDDGAPPAVSLECSRRCCWRWLSEMLLQEMKQMKVQSGNAREGFLEQDRAIAALKRRQATLPKGSEGYEEYCREHEALKASQSELASELEHLTLDSARLSHELQVRKKASYEVQRRHRELQREHEAALEKTTTLEEQKLSAETELCRLGASCTEKNNTLEDTERQIARRKQDVASAMAEMEQLRNQILSFRAKKSPRSSPKAKSKAKAK